MQPRSRRSADLQQAKSHFRAVLGARNENAPTSRFWGAHPPSQPNPSPTQKPTPNPPPKANPNPTQSQPKPQRNPPKANPNPTQSQPPPHPKPTQSQPKPHPNPTQNPNPKTPNAKPTQTPPKPHPNPTQSQPKAPGPPESLLGAFSSERSPPKTALKCDFACCRSADLRLRGCIPAALSTLPRKM